MIHMVSYETRHHSVAPNALTCPQILDGFEP